MTTPDELDIDGHTVSYTYRTPGKYALAIPSYLEARITLRGGQGGGGGAGLTGGGKHGEGGGAIVPGGPGMSGGRLQTEWFKGGGDALHIEVGQGGKGGRGVLGLHGGQGEDGWVKIEVRRMGLRSRLRYLVSRLWQRAYAWGSAWLTWQKAGVVVGIIALSVTVIFGVIAILSE